ncbi:unnamed protein product [Calypogeia fissa]
METEQHHQVIILNDCPWSNYPEELHMAILKRLPWVDKLRLRRVCKVWNAILRDPELLRSSRPPEGSASPFCCLNPHSHGGEFLIYSPLGRSWHGFSSLPSFRVIAAAAGLLLMEGAVGGKRTLILLNPLNRARRQLLLPLDLEDIPLQRSCVFEMTLDKDTDRIRILAGVWHVSDDPVVRHPYHRHWHDWKFYVYHVDSNLWKVVANLSLRDEGYPVFTLAEQLPSAALMGNDLFFLSTFHGTSPHLYRIKTTEQPADECVKLGLEQDLVVGGAPLPMSSSYVESRLFESEGRLLLILRQRFGIGNGDDFVNNMWELSMYEFDFGASEWKTVLSLPGILARSRSFVSFDVGGGFVCFHNDELTGICDLASKTLTVLPSPVRMKSRHPPTTTIFLFEPRLDIIL